MVSKKNCLASVFGLLLAGGNILISATFAIANEIEWILVPGTRESDTTYGSYEVLIGSNTISRDGSAINFDYLHTADFAYARVAGNCTTGWKTMIASGYYTENGDIAIRNERPMDFNPSASAGPAAMALDFACTQSTQ